MLKVGDTIWRFNINRRVYAPKKPGEIYSRGGPIYREHWEPVKIDGETSRSWVTRFGKAPKKGDRHGWAFSLDEVDASCWAKEHRRHIVNLVERCDADTLKAIGDLVGYVPAAPKP